MAEALVAAVLNDVDKRDYAPTEIKYPQIGFSCAYVAGMVILYVMHFVVNRTPVIVYGNINYKTYLRTAMRKLMFAPVLLALSYLFISNGNDSLASLWSDTTKVMIHNTFTENIQWWAGYPWMMYYLTWFMTEFCVIQRSKAEDLRTMSLVASICMAGIWSISNLYMFLVLILMAGGCVLLIMVELYICRAQATNWGDWKTGVYYNYVLFWIAQFVFACFFSPINGVGSEIAYMWTYNFTTFGLYGFLCLLGPVAFAFRWPRFGENFIGWAILFPSNDIENRPLVSSAMKNPVTSPPTQLGGQPLASQSRMPSAAGAQRRLGQTSRTGL